MLPFTLFQKSSSRLILRFAFVLSRAASVAASVVGSQDGSRRGRLVIWPEFQEADMNAEKWVSESRLQRLIVACASRCIGNAKDIYRVRKKTMLNKNLIIKICSSLLMVNN